MKKENFLTTTIPEKQFTLPVSYRDVTIPVKGTLLLTIMLRPFTSQTIRHIDVPLGYVK